jgi:hypothetical protein
MTGCAIAAFIPVAYFDGISTTRHMAGMNMATALPVPISIALAISMIHQAPTRTRQRSQPPRRNTFPPDDFSPLPSAGQLAVGLRRPNEVQAPACIVRDPGRRLLDLVV